jgi:hypothetical protein
MKMRWALFSAGILAACSTDPAKHVAATELTICQINATADDLAGVLVRSSGTYKTDGMNYSFLVDPSCGDKANGIDIGKAWGVRDYDALRRTWTKECDRTGRRIFCTVQAQAMFTGYVRRSDEGGHLVIDLESIHQVHAANVARDVEFPVGTRPAAASVPPEGLPQSARTPVYPADRESLFEDLAHNVLFLCRRPELQAAARLSETDCKRHVLAVKGGCKAEARERIAETSIASRQRYEQELKQFIDCLIPPTPSQARPFQGEPWQIARQE